MNDTTENALNKNDNDLGILINKFDELIAATLHIYTALRIPFDKALWNIDDIAEYLKLRFNNAKKGHPRWYAREVIDWVAMYREG